MTIGKLLESVGTAPCGFQLDSVAKGTLNYTWLSYGSPKFLKAFFVDGEWVVGNASKDIPSEDQDELIEFLNEEFN